VTEDEIRELKHECARLRHEVQDRIDLMENQYGPVAYRTWNEYSLRYVYIDYEDSMAMPEEERDSWEPLYIRYVEQVSI